MHESTFIDDSGIDSGDRIEIEVVYARPEEQVLVGLRLASGATVEQAIQSSGLLEHFPEIDLSINKVGLFGSVCALDQPLKKNDRVEIYRLLMRDPKDRRRLRAAKR